MISVVVVIGVATGNGVPACLALCSDCDRSWDLSKAIEKFWGLDNRIDYADVQTTHWRPFPLLVGDLFPENVDENVPYSGTLIRHWWR